MITILAENPQEQSFEVLKWNPRYVLQKIRGLGEFGNARIAIIGDLAMRHHFDDARPAKVVEFIITNDRAPTSVKTMLLEKHPNRFKKAMDPFFHTGGPGPGTQIDIYGDHLCPFVPAEAVTVQGLRDGHFPFISAKSLIAYKVYSCSMRSDVEKRIKDAKDTEFMLNRLTGGTGTLTLTVDERAAAEDGLLDLLESSDEKEDWWRARLGI